MILFKAVFLGVATLAVLGAVLQGSTDAAGKRALSDVAFATSVALPLTPTDQDQCKDGGWISLVDSQGNSFKNQGDCVAFVVSKGKNLAGLPYVSPTPSTTPTATATSTPTPTATSTATPTPTPTPSHGAPILYFSLDTAGAPGGVAVENEDIVGFDGTVFWVAFDGSDVGLTGLTIDAFDFLSSNEIIMSFAEDGAIPGIAGIVDDADLVLFTASSLNGTTSGTFSLYFDGSDVGLDSSLEDIDAVQRLPDGRLLISIVVDFDADGLIGGDADLFAFTPTLLGETTAGTWSLYFNSVNVGLSDSSEDVDAVSIKGSSLYLSTILDFAVAGLSGANEDVFVCVGLVPGETTSCASWSLFFDGSAFGLSTNNINAIDIP